MNTASPNEIHPLLDSEANHSLTHALVHPNPTTQLLLTSKPLIHTQEAGLNPLVDAAAHLFSLMGKLKLIKHYKRLDKLHAELIAEISNFQQTVQSYTYNTECLAEYVPISCYALCITLDDIIMNTPWGSEGSWDEYRLVKTFNQEPLSPENFLIILERLVRDPAIYIDVMEFMYICLSLGLSFRGNHSSSDLGHEQLEQITYSLYKRIRAYRGTFNKVLSPYSIKPPHKPRTKSAWKEMPNWMVILMSTLLFVAAFAAGKFLIDYLAT